MNKERKDFETDTEYFGYIESGKAVGTRDFYKPESKYCEQYQRGWDIGKKEIEES